MPASVASRSGRVPAPPKKKAGSSPKDKAKTKAAPQPFGHYSYDQLQALLQYADRFSPLELAQMEAALARAADRIGYVDVKALLSLT